MAAYHESRAKALSEYFTRRDPETPRIVQVGRIQESGWQSETIDTVDRETDQVVSSEGHFERRIPDVQLLHSTR